MICHNDVIITRSSRTDTVRDWGRSLTRGPRAMATLWTRSTAGRTLIGSWWTKDTRLQCVVRNAPGRTFVWNKTITYQHPNYDIFFPKDTDFEIKKIDITALDESKGLEITYSWNVVVSRLAVLSLKQNAQRNSNHFCVYKRTQTIPRIFYINTLKHFQSKSYLCNCPN